ncbi:Adaptor protein complex AP-1 gamma subunit [Carpediemonas membranifera]|uniref:Adaptor protein complex AP-1 gamma subunit n=1 Tax=Carpediemonas membranifera TaxID=201153 RepID=A0A8J6B3L7_9EUKA|nr:Adaptor protein complex AP-1 gamma subunit [Carpediemonas membranifera]|eukprot:KAG9392264.1 Adaptor protein complex AP-1 gamma subunit [Carpediemonas membranifera]
MGHNAKDFAKLVRNCSNQQSERECVATESLVIRTDFKSPDISDSALAENLEKLIFINLLGYPTQSSQMNIVQMMAAAREHKAKRCAYLCYGLLVEDTDVMMMATNSIRKDLKSAALHTVDTALQFMGSAGHPDLLEDLYPDVLALLTDRRKYIVKKAAQAAVRIVRLLPESSDKFIKPCLTLLKDRALVLAGLQLAVAIMRYGGPDMAAYCARELLPAVGALATLVKTMAQGYKTTAVQKTAPDVFIICAAVEFFGLLLAYVPSDDARRCISELLLHMPLALTAHAAILLEASRMVLETCKDETLQPLALNVLFRFLSHKDTNLRYAALTSMPAALSLNPTVVRRHTSAIVSTLDDASPVIRRRGLHVLLQVTDGETAKTTIRLLTEYLERCDKDLVPAVVSGLDDISQRYAPTPRWDLDTMLDVMTRTPLPKDTGLLPVTARLIKLIRGHEDLQGYATMRLHGRLTASGPLALHLLAISVVGAYCSTVVSDNVSPESVVAGIVKAMRMSSGTASGPVKRVGLYSLAHVARQYPDTRSDIVEFVKSYRTNLDLEIQQRAIEVVGLLGLEPHEISSVLCGDDLGAVPEDRAIDDDLMDLLGGVANDASATQTPATPATPAEMSNDLMALLSGANAASPAPAMAEDAEEDLLADLLPSKLAQAKPQPAAPESARPAPLSTAPMMPADVFSQPVKPKERVSAGQVVIELEPKSSEGGVFTMDALISCPVALDHVMLQAAAPRHMTVKLSPPSSREVGPGLPIAQQIVLTQGEGTGPLALRFRVEYVQGEAKEVHVCDANLAKMFR